MNCLEAENYISALYDSENVPPTAAQHIANCGNCRKILDDYSKVGTELRIAVALQSCDLPELHLPPARNRLRFLWARVSVPRFAIAGLIVSVIVAAVTASLVIAQPRPLWFQFAYGLQRDPQFYKVARKGYDEPVALTGMVNGAVVGARLRMQIDTISTDNVSLHVRAVSAGVERSADGFKFAPDLTKNISLTGTSTINYKPGQLVAIPVEGGDTIYLKGEVLDHQPQIAFGLPLQPAATELVLRAPVLTSGGRLLGDLDGGSSVANTPDSGVRLGCGPNGVFIFGLRHFPGAVAAQANWGEVTFRLNGQPYRLTAVAPITGGNQPTTIWVRNDAASDTQSGPFIGNARLPETDGHSPQK